jgi:hypothetical protein
MLKITSYKIRTCLLHLTSVCEQKENISSVSLFKVNNKVLLTAIGRTKARGLRRKADWISGERCGSLPIVTQKGLNEDRCKLSDKIMLLYYICNGYTILPWFLVIQVTVFPVLQM